MSTCPGDCCRLIFIHDRLDVHVEKLNNNLFTGNHIDPVIVYMLDEQPDGSHECRYFNRATRRCEAYANRPGMCSDFPCYLELGYGHGGVPHYCENCSYDSTRPTDPGQRYAAIEETGIFCHDNQPEMADRLERMR